MNTKPRIATLLLVIAMVAAACGGDDLTVDTSGGGLGSGSPDGVFGDEGWLLVGGTVDGSTFALLESHPVTLQVSGSNVSGTAACNGYFGTLMTDEGARFDGLGATEMACDPPEAMQLESEFLSALARVTNASRDGEQLVLSGEATELTFDPVAPKPDATLEGTGWELDTLIQGDVASSVLNNGRVPTLSFSNGSELAGSDGCNSFGASYELSGGTLIVGDLLGTLIGCEPDIDRQAQHVTGVLRADPSFEISGDRLTLTAPDGLGLSYRAA